MGATGSRSSSSPPTDHETFVVKRRIPEYSKLLRVPAGRTFHRVKVVEILFCGLGWVLNLVAANKDDDKAVCVELIMPQQQQQGGNRPPVFVVGFGMSIEILDETGEHTVFHAQSSRRTCEEGRLMLAVRETVLKVSSCIRRRDDSITIKCRLLFGKSEVAPCLASSKIASHTLTVRSLSELKATLPSDQYCAYSTRFAVGGSSWHLAFYPTRTVVRLIRPTNEDDETRTTAEFSFALQGAVNVQSGKMRHTFDLDKSFYEFAYQEPPPSVSSTTTDKLVVRCCIQVIPAVVVPTTMPRTKSELSIPLLSAMHVG